jgi:hypothetical protein
MNNWPLGGIRFLCNNAAVGDDVMTYASPAPPIGRGRGSGALLVLLGTWGALVPFVGPMFGYAYTPDKAWAYTAGRLWLSVLPGAVTLLGGLLVLASARAAAVGAVLAALAGAWFVIGPAVTALVFPSGSVSPGTPVGTSGPFGVTTMHFLEGLGFFYGLGVVIVFFAALALGKSAAARAAGPGYLAQENTEPVEYHPPY